MTPERLLDHLDAGRPWVAAERAGLPADVDHAGRLALQVRALRMARGERPAGWKIGFTNRTIWQRYGVHAPIWGTVWDTTLVSCDGRGHVDLAATCEPRIEPEIVFGLAATPPREATLDALFACIGWLAPGFEIVQSHAPDWKFSAAETIADGALHARLLVGRRLPLREVADDAAALAARLAASGVQLRRDGAPVEQGRGANVLDDPLHALLHFVHGLRRQPGAPALRPGDVVTTGTWTDAWPVAPGELWRADFDAPLGSIEVELR